jgi:hypothetical protein
MFRRYRAAGAEYKVDIVVTSGPCLANGVASLKGVSSGQDQHHHLLVDEIFTWWIHEWSVESRA